jgi:MerR family mercuric resistance operon transcriptional regulator
MKVISIGTISKSSGISVEAIRYYEREGLLEKAKRSESGYRQYHPDVLRRLAFIRRAQDLGFSLEEIRELLRLRTSTKSSCRSVRAKAEEKISIVEKKIAELQLIKQALEVLASTCTNGDAPTSTCPILDALDPENEEPL